MNDLTIPFSEPAGDVKLVCPKFVNKYTGEVQYYKTVSNVSPDKGVENTGEDLCRKEDFEPIGAVIARFLRSGGVEKVVSDEYAYDEKSKPDISEDDAFDHVDPDADILDQQMDLEEYIDGRIASGASDFAVDGPEAGASEEQAQASDEQASMTAGEKPSE